VRHYGAKFTPTAQPLRQRVSDEVRLLAVSANAVGRVTFTSPGADLDASSIRIRDVDRHIAGLVTFGDRLERRAAKADEHADEITVATFTEARAFGVASSATARAPGSSSATENT